MSLPKDDTPDPETGLTPRERQIVVDTWGIVKPVAKEAGVELFKRLVDSYTCMGLCFIIKCKKWVIMECSVLQQGKICGSDTEISCLNLRTWVTSTAMQISTRLYRVTDRKTVSVTVNIVRTVSFRWLLYDGRKSPQNSNVRLFYRFHAIRETSFLKFCQ